MLINFETYKKSHIPKVQWVIQFPDVLPPCISRVLILCCQTVEGCVSIKHSNTGFNTRWKAYLTWQYSRNNWSDLSKMAHARTLTLFRNVGSLRKKKKKEEEEQKKRNLIKPYDEIWTVAKDRHMKPRNKRMHRISSYIVFITHNRALTLSYL